MLPPRIESIICYSFFASQAVFAVDNNRRRSFVFAQAKNNNLRTLSQHLPLIDKDKNIDKASEIIFRNLRRRRNAILIVEEVEATRERRLYGDKDCLFRRRRLGTKSRQVKDDAEEEIDATIYSINNGTLPNLDLISLKNESAAINVTDADLENINNGTLSNSTTTSINDTQPATPEAVVEGAPDADSVVEKDDEEPTKDFNAGTNDTSTDTTPPKDVQDAENADGGASENAAWKISILIIVAISAAAGVAIGVVTAVVYGNRKRRLRASSSRRSKPRSRSLRSQNSLDSASESVGGQSRGSNGRAYSPSESDAVANNVNDDHDIMNNDIMRSSSNLSGTSNMSSQRYHIIPSIGSSRISSSLHGSEMSAGSMPEAYVKGKRSGKAGRPDSYVDGQRRMFPDSPSSVDDP